jgi:S-adenosyl methyltransferase
VKGTVLAHAPALITSTPDGRTALPDADFMDPEAILDSPQLRDGLDLGKPVGLLLVAMLMYVDPAEGHDTYPVVRTLLDALPAGSHVAISHPTGDFDPDARPPYRQSSGRRASRSCRAAIPRSHTPSTAANSSSPVSCRCSRGAPDPQDTPSVDLQSAYYWAGIARES